jgi:hypothetical protein
MSFRDELIKLALSFFGVTVLGSAFASFWTSRQKSREIEQLELKFFYDHYGQLLTAVRLWNAAKSKKLPLFDEAARYELLKQASAAESALEGMLLKLASERILTREAQSMLGRFRQSCQMARQSIRDGVQVPWLCSEQETYQDFKQGAAFFASLLRKPVWMQHPTSHAARKAVCEITSNKHEIKK